MAFGGMGLNTLEQLLSLLLHWNQGQAFMPQYPLSHQEPPTQSTLLLP